MNAPVQYSLRDRLAYLVLLLVVLSVLLVVVDLPTKTSYIEG